jgi:4-hydroxy-tetrahydrodipicolinate synthase
MNPAGIHALFEGWNGPSGAALQARADVVRNIFQSVPMIPAMKRAVAEFAHDASWATVRPPLCALADSAATELLGTLAAAGFDMPGYPQA